MAIHADDLIFDKKEQLDKIDAYCLPDEIIRAVFDLKGAGTGLIGLTDKRIIFLDKEFMRSQKAMVSIPYSRIGMVASEDKQGIFKKGFFASNKLILTGMGFQDKIFEFRGSDKAHQAHNIMMEYLL